MPSRRYQPPPPPTPKVFSSAQEISRAVEKLKRRLQAIEALEARKVRHDSAEIDNVESDVRNAVLEIFGSQSPEYDEHQHFQISGGPFKNRMIRHEGEAQRRYEDGIPDAKTILQGLIARLEEKLLDFGDGAGSVATAPESATATNDVFVVHGHDTEAREWVARTLHRLGLNPIILHERPNQGRTLIEKLERNAIRPGFAIVILSEDDEGREKGAEGPLLPRARQNVVLELGLFIGKLDRERVLVLKKGNPEQPSDIAGIVYESMDPGGAWRFKLVNELRAAGYSVSADALLAR